MKRLTIFICAILLCSLTSQAQNRSPQTLFGNRGLQFSGIWGGTTTSITKFDQDYAVYSGGYGGLEFGRSLFVGWGGFKLVSDVDLSSLANNRFDMRYNGLMLGYAFKSYKVIHPTFMVLAGKGKVNVNNEGEDKVFVIQPALGVELNVLKWFRIGLEGGYRIVTDTDLKGISDEDLSAPFGEVKFKFGISWGRYRN
ncbi:MAG: hypothetical protein AB8G15_13920 [Saprospiraceae bacterium]